MDHAIAQTRPAAHRTGLLSRLGQMAAVRRQRRALASLNDHLLKDIGLSAEEARQEAESPLWDVPANWRR